MTTIEIIVMKEMVGTRLDVLVSSQIDGLSRTRTTELIRDGFVLVDNEKKKAKCQPPVGSVIEVSIPEVESTELVAENLNLDILYEDQDVAVVNKPSGMVVHPSIGHGRKTLANGLMYQIKDLSGINGQKRPGIVHRIDKDTSGLLMIAKNDFAHESLSNQLKERTVKREYVALVHDVIEHRLGKINAPIGRDEKKRMRYEVTSSGKDAVTHFEVLHRFVGYTLIKCRLETGRTHQIRVHMRYIGHPLVGDPLYGPKRRPIHYFGQFLHAKTIGFNHPRTGKFMSFEVDPPAAFTHYVEKLKYLT